ncbi:MAG TPA: DUF2934 domain-containing protein [Bacteroidales bacterium]|nr:DUF2934 domain-containing protein [Bacteroidales bacterium]
METKAKVTNKKAVSKKVTAKTDTKKTKKDMKITAEQIQERAYQIYLEKGQKGSELENWLQAEKELKKIR